MVDHQHPFKNFRLDIDDARRQLAQHPAPAEPANLFPSAKQLGPILTAKYQAAQQGKPMNESDLIGLLVVAQEQLAQTMNELAANIARLIDLQSQSAPKQEGQQ